jgi:hypothetical protein
MRYTNRFSLGCVWLVALYEYVLAYGYCLDSKCCICDVNVLPYVVHNVLIFGIGSWFGLLVVLIDL